MCLFTLLLTDVSSTAGPGVIPAQDALEEVPSSLLWLWTNADADLLPFFQLFPPLFHQDIVGLLLPLTRALGLGLLTPTLPGQPVPGHAAGLGYAGEDAFPCMAWS